LLPGTLFVVTIALAPLTIFVVALIIAHTLSLFYVAAIVAVWSLMLSCQPLPAFDAPVAS
jgi:hypothetical protein